MGGHAPILPSLLLVHFNAAALELGHTDTRIIFAHYRELVLPTKAERYWRIRPDGILEPKKDEKVVAMGA